VTTSSSEVLRDADLALYAAKAAGKNGVRVFDHHNDNDHRSNAR
jgi:predicted signal transduction protein with EAL and GGDEF domain